jgi:basic amino acid/polyamine antiporter, APA family
LSKMAVLEDPAQHEGVAAGRSRMVRVLGTAFGIAICVGSTVGVGILRVPGEVTALLGGSAWSACAWLLGGVYLLLSANYLAELATMLPHVGGPYVYAHRAFGDLGGFVVGFCDWSLITAALAFLAVAFGEYVAILFPSFLGRESAVAALILLLIALVNALGLRAGDATQRAASGITALALLLFVAACLGAPDSTFEPRAAPAGLSLSSAALAMPLVIATYGGWNAPVYFAEESRDPARSVPRALFLGALVVVALYLLINVALWQVLSFDELSSSKLPAATALERIVGPAGSKFVTILALALFVSIINAGILTTPRVLVGLSRGQLIFSALSYVTRSGVPAIALGLTVSVAVLLATTGTFVSLLTHYAVIAVVINLVLVASYFRMRRTEATLARPFRAWGHPVAPGLAMLVDAALLIGLIVSRSRSTLYSLLMIALAYPLYLVCRRLRTTRLAQQTGSE